MARYHTRLERKEVQRIFFQLCLALSSLKNEKEAAQFLRDLISYQEAEMIAKRLKIAEYLLENVSYDDIKKKLKVSFGTIAKVQTWLRVSGDGYREAVKKTKGKEINLEEELPIENDWSSMKKRFPMYYWPQILLEEVVKSANMKEKKRIGDVLKQMDKMKTKNKLFKQLQKMISTGKQF
jgi:TrpR-related protein YerC/YecD